MAEQPPRLVHGRPCQRLPGQADVTIAYLEAEKQRVYGEIKNYPTPITGCDQQFNALLEEQARIVAQLRRLEEAQSSEAGL
ncbi:MAG TPA: hypothetical protein VHD36_03115 [Pirellulales bacterium]|nr:hypothetical protein [Pirellulales bacterium]